MFKLIKRMLREEEGVTAVEYGLIAALVAVAAIGALSTMSDSLSGLFEEVSQQIDAPVEEASGSGTGG